jgi:hypothetical protein
MAPPAKVAELADRLAGVEALLNQMRAKEDNPSAVATTGGTDSLERSADGELETASSPDTMGNEEERYADCPFWKALCEQVRLVYSTGG